MMGRPAAYIALLLHLTLLAPRSSAALLSPEGAVFKAYFDPPYDDTTLKLQMKVLDWWRPFSDTAVLPKGTQIPVLEDDCVSNPSSCRAWTVPGDVTLQIVTPTIQDTNRVYIFLNDTGARVSIYGAPYERAAPGCSSAPGAACCGGQELTLQLDAVQHSVFRMFVSRYNGTYVRDGTIGPPAATQLLPPPAVPAKAPPTQAPAPPLPSGAQGPAVAFVATLPTYTVDSFDDAARAEYARSLQRASLGASPAPAVQIRSATAAGRGAARRLLASDAVVVDTVVQFVPTDTTASLILLTALRNRPAAVLPPAQYGAATVADAAELNCVTPCGLHGSPAPRPTGSGTIGCTCECQEGWATAPNQPFDSFKYCALANSAADGTPAPPGVVAPYPPPAPVQFKEGGGLGVGGYVGIVVAILGAGGVGYLAWRTKCCGGLWCRAAACCWQRCAGGAKTRDGAEGDAMVEAAPPAKHPKKQRILRPEGNEDDAPTAAEEGGDVKSPEGSLRVARKKVAAKKGMGAKKHPAGQ